MLILEEIDKGRCISIDVRLNPPEAIGTTLPCLRDTGTEEIDTKKLKKLLDKAAYSMRMWTTLCSAISKAEFIKYNPSCPHTINTNHAGLNVEVSSGAPKAWPPLVPASGGRYNSRQVTVQQRQEQIKKSDNQKPVQKEDKELKTLDKLREKVQVLEGDKRNLKQINSELKASRKMEVDDAVAKEKIKATNKTDQLVKQLDATQQNLAKTSSKLNDLSIENADLKAKKREYESKRSAFATHKSAENPLATPSVADRKTASETPKLPTPASIAEEYKSIVSIVNKTETEIAISRIQSENCVALAKMEEDKKREVFHCC